jgi:hypothetical protein
MVSINMVNVVNIVVDWLALCFLEVPASNLDLDNDCPLCEGIRGMSEKCFKAGHERCILQPVLFPDRYLLLDAVQRDLRTTSLHVAQIKTNAMVTMATVSYRGCKVHEFARAYTVITMKPITVAARSKA